MYCRCKSSQDRFNNVKEKYGENSILYYGDWSRSDHVIPLQPSYGMKKLLSIRFRLEEVDEHLTSQTCSLCLGKLQRYWRRNGILSYARL